jgi:glycosyltransferase involved in cell wall biosynthesis
MIRLVTLSRDQKEGISEFAEPLANLPFVDLKIAISQEGRFVPHGQMPEFLNSLDVYVLASRSEGFPLKGLEASACGCAIVTTRVGGMEDLIIDGRTGIFLERSMKDLIGKITMLNENRGRVRKLGRACRQVVESRWGWETRAEDWYKFIRMNVK